MVYKNHVVAVVKVDGKVLRESGNEILVPFGSEYSVLLKNLNSVRVKVKVSIDGRDATDGTEMVIAPNSNLELERFITNGNLSAGNRFKFIERTDEIENYRGVGAEDGLIRIEYRTEKIFCYNNNITGQPYWAENTKSSSGNAASGGVGGVFRSSGKLSAASLNMCCDNHDGITVEGDQSNQTFVYAQDFSTEAQSDVVVLKLRGTVSGKKVKQAVAVRTKTKCKTCGLSNKGPAQFCGRCGTALVLYA